MPQNPTRQVHAVLAVITSYSIHYTKLYDRLIEALDNLIDTPDPAPPIALAQPKVLYTYADPALEARSAGQRILLRMGTENRAKAIKALTAIRKELLSRSPAKE